MVKRKVETINEILMGDTLAELAARLDIGDDSKVIGIVVVPEGVRVASSGCASKHEVLGALYQAVEEVMSMGRYEN